VKKVRCALCNSDDSEILFREGSFKKGGGEIALRNVICRCCGLVYLNPRSTQAEYNDLYRNSFFKVHESIADVEEIKKRLKQKGYKKGKRVFSFFSSCLDSSSKVLDVGCGYGVVLKIIKDSLNCKIEGIEPNSVFAEFASRYFNLNIFRGSFGKYYKEFEDKRHFDLIVLHHVFEHFLEPNFIFSCFKKLLKPKGHLYVEIPNVSAIKTSPVSFFQFFHPYNYSPFTFYLMSFKAGFKIVKFDDASYPNRMRFILTHVENSQKALPSHLFQRGNNYKNVIRIVKRNQFKYSILQFIWPAGKIIPQPIRKKLRLLLKKI